MARPDSEQREGSRRPIHIANAMMSNDTLPYVVISADPSIKIGQQCVFVVSRNSSHGGVQRVIKEIFHII